MIIIVFARPRGRSNPFCSGLLRIDDARNDATTKGFMMKQYLLVLLSLFAITTSALAKPLVVYSGRSEALVGPIFEQFEKDTGIELDVRYNSSSALATQLLQERDDSPADVIFLQEIGYLTVLGNADLLQTLPPDMLNQVPERFQEDEGRWLGTSARARVLAYNTNLVKEEDLPKTLEELADPKWKGKLGWAPSNASFQAHVSALRTLWGEEKTEEWLKAMIEDKPTAYPKNATQVSAVGNGEIAVAWTNHYYINILKQQNPNLPVKSYNFPTPHDAGNLLIVCGAGITQHTTNRKEAEQLLNYLISEPVQERFVNEVFEYPARQGIPVNPDVASLESIQFADVDQGSMADVEPTLELLKKYGLI